MTAPSAVNPAIQRRKRAEKWLGDRIIYALFHLIRISPPRATSVLGSFFGQCYYTFIRGHRRLALNNLRKAFPTLADREISQLARKVFRNFGKSAIEFLRIPFMDNAEINRRVCWEGREHLDAALAHGTGVMLITAHFGNWEMMATKIRLDGYALDVIARNSELPSTTAIINRIRESSGVRVFPRGSLLPAVRALKENRILGILPDQHDLDGIFVDFFGYPAKTPIGPAAIALRTGALILPVFTFREGDDVIRIEMSPAFAAKDTGNKEADIASLTQAISSIIEENIRKAPDQWLWFHNRWKSKPELPVATPDEKVVVEV